MDDNKVDEPRTVTRQTAFELFGEMRHSTPEEQELMRKCHKKMSRTVEGINMFDLPEEVAAGKPLVVDIGLFEDDKPDSTPAE